MYDFYIPTRILFGRGRLKTLHEQKLPGKKALVVISAGRSVKTFGYLDALLEELAKADVEYVVYDKILPNPQKRHVNEGGRLAREQGCDFVVGLGGGSSIDSAKAIAVVASNGGDYWDYIEGGSGKNLPVKNAPLPVVAITTTAGTGTEADPWTVITNEKNEKIGFGLDSTFPVLSVVDPLLMTSVPPELTAYQGFDALFHSAEGYINKRANPLSDTLALKAVELIGANLARAVADGSDADARENLALANTLSGMVETLSGCTSEHSMEHALSAFHPQLPHGAGLIALSRPYYGFFVENRVCGDRLSDLSRALGGGCEPQDFLTALEKLKRDCGVEAIDLSLYGAERDRAGDYARNALETMGGLFERDPVKISEKQCEKIICDAFTR